MVGSVLTGVRGFCAFLTFKSRLDSSVVEKRILYNTNVNLDFMLKIQIINKNM